MYELVGRYHAVCSGCSALIDSRKVDITFYISPDEDMFLYCPSCVPVSVRDALAACPHCSGRARGVSRACGHAIGISESIVPGQEVVSQAGEGRPPSRQVRRARERRARSLSLRGLAS